MKKYYKNVKEQPNTISEDLRFYEAACRERFAYKQWSEMYDMFSIEKGYGVHLTPPTGMEKYDSIIQKYDSNMTCLKRYITEFKVRQVSGHNLKLGQTEGWILEKSKFNSLKNICKLDEDRNEMLYINFLPHKTIVWNLTTLEKKGLLKWISKDMNKATMKSRDDKKSKKVCLLKEEWGLPYKYIFDEFLFQRDQKNNDIKRRRKEDTRNIGKTFTDLLNGLDSKT